MKYPTQLRNGLFVFTGESCPILRFSRLELWQFLIAYFQMRIKQQSCALNEIKFERFFYFSFELGTNKMFVSRPERKLLHVPQRALVYLFDGCLFDYFFNLEQ